MVLYIVYFFTFWQLLYDFNKDCKQMFLVFTLLLLQAPAFAPHCPWGAGLGLSLHVCLVRKEEGGRGGADGVHCSRDYGVGRKPHGHSSGCVLVLSKLSLV